MTLHAPDRAARRTPAVSGSPASSALAMIAARVDDRLAAFLDARLGELGPLGEEAVSLGNEVRRLVAAGGKRLRPAFVYWGARLAGAEDDVDAVTVGAAVELVHAFALVHDDVMDRSSTRRGLPTVHRSLASHHRTAGRTGDADWFGISGAILAGDLALTWSDELLELAGLPPDRFVEVRQRFHRLRSEVIVGQYLELRLASNLTPRPGDPLRVALLKSGRYTVTRPLQIGTAIAAPDGSWRAPLARYGDATGVAFQLRDEVLGLFGSPQSTGKSALDDLREGRRTSLVVTALDQATPDQRRLLLGHLGDAALDEDGADEVRRIVRDTGSLDAVEQLIASHTQVAHDAAQALPVTARSALLELLDLVANRDR